MPGQGRGADAGLAPKGSLRAAAAAQAMAAAAASSSAGEEGPLPASVASGLGLGGGGAKGEAADYAAAFKDFAGFDPSSLVAFELDRSVEVRVLHAGAVLLEEPKAAAKATSATSTRNGLSGGSAAGGFPLPPPSAHYKIALVSHRGPRPSCESRAASVRYANAQLRATGSSSSGGGEGGGGLRASASASEAKKDGFEVLVFELGPEATAFDLGDWVKALTAGKAFTKFKAVDGPDFSRPPVAAPPHPGSYRPGFYGGPTAASHAASAVGEVPPPAHSGGAAAAAAAAAASLSSSFSVAPLSASALAAADPWGLRVPLSPLVDLMGACDERIAASAREGSVRDAAVVREASLGLAGCLRYQPLRSALKRALKDRMADEGLLFWAHARDYAAAFDRRDKEGCIGAAESSSLSSLPSSSVRPVAAFELDAGLSASSSSAAAPSPAHLAALSFLDPSSKALRVVEDAVFEDGAASAAEAICSLYLDPAGDKRLTTGPAAAQESDVRRVLGLVPEYKLALRTSRVPGAVVKPAPPPPPAAVVAAPAEARAKPPKPPPPTAPRLRGPVACESCTFVNEKPTALACELCGTPLGSPLPSAAADAEASTKAKPPPPPGPRPVGRGQTPPRGLTAPHPGTGSHVVSAGHASGFGRDHPAAGGLFSDLACAVFRSLEASDDFIDLCAANTLGSDEPKEAAGGGRGCVYRRMLRAAPAHARANRRGMANPLAPRAPPPGKARRVGSVYAVRKESVADDVRRKTAPQLALSATKSVAGALALAANDDEEEEDETEDWAMTGSTFKPAALQAKAAAAKSAPAPSALGRFNSVESMATSPLEGAEKQVPRTYSSMFFGKRPERARSATQVAKEEAEAYAAEQAAETQALEAARARAPTLALQEEAWVRSGLGPLAASPAAAAAAATGTLAAATRSTAAAGGFVVPTVLRIACGFLGEVDAWPDEFAGVHAMAMLSGSARHARLAGLVEPTSCDATVRAERWWQAACAEELALAASRVGLDERRRAGHVPAWAPCELRLPVDGRASDHAPAFGPRDPVVLEALGDALFDGQRQRQRKAQRLWRTARDSDRAAAGGSAASAFMLRRPEGRACAWEGGGPGLAATARERTAIQALAKVPGRVFFSCPVRAVWRARDPLAASVAERGLSAFSRDKQSDESSRRASLVAAGGVMPQPPPPQQQQQQQSERGSTSSIGGDGILLSNMLAVGLKGDEGSSEVWAPSGWAASERLQTFASFTAASARYLCVMTEVFDTVAFAAAAAAAGCHDLSPAVVAGGGGRSGGGSASGSTSGSTSGRTALLCFLREGSGRLERVLHAKDLLWCGPAAKPAHCVSLMDGLGECCVLLAGPPSGLLGTGGSGGGSGGVDAVSTVLCRDAFMASIERCGGGAVRRPPLARFPVYESVVKKKGGGRALTRWQARRFVLDAPDGCIRYYDEASGELRGGIPVATIDSVSPGQEAYFTLVSKPTDKKQARGSADKNLRVWDLQAANAVEMRDWVLAIEHCLAERKNRARQAQMMSSQARLSPNVHHGDGDGSIAGGGATRPAGGASRRIGR